MKRDKIVAELEALAQKFVNMSFETREWTPDCNVDYEDGWDSGHESGCDDCVNELDKLIEKIKNKEI